MNTKLILLAILIGWTAAASAQVELSPVMVAFKEFCIRGTIAAAQCKVDQLQELISGWTPAEYDADGNESEEEKFVYKNQKIDYEVLGDIDYVDTLQEVSTVGHFKFLPAEIDNWIVNQCEPIELDDIGLLRGRWSINIEYTVRALKPKSKAVYSTHGAGKIELLAVAEWGGKINMSAHTVEQNFKREITQESDYEDIVAGGREYSQLAFSMSRNGEITITIENTTDQPISFILVKK